ncbi:Dihydrolipoyllysine-residue acetyltransferase component 3 of pyruvate dehydrogenase complex [Morus notabilis]|uniref:Dihydrolipoyllysine-residue acetyltransferase component 3 of pyruvate dehydrogenase complex n=1 Tax=Morus notabilis TaxID=981085 RepID=W9RZL0_9ROSA|nr:Dihydrolipoyllysine-residue acetyltransferase component 3 of pyruvate dehydrogenase complex [Morus notabilis]
MNVETFYDGRAAPVGTPIGLLAETEDEVAEAKAKAAANSSSSSFTSSSGSPSHPHPTSTAAPAISQPSPPLPTTKPASDGPRKIVARPYAKKLAKHHKVDIGSVVRTGPFGRIITADVEAKAKIAPSKSIISAASALASLTAAAPPPLKASSGGSGSLPPPLPGSTVVPFMTMQAAVSKNMVESLSVPTFRVCYPVTTDALDALYEKHPVMNTSCKDSKSFTYNSNINIVVVVAINGGLITPVLQDADKGAIMVVGASKPTVVADADGFFSVKSKMLIGCGECILGGRTRNRSGRRGTWLVTNGWENLFNEVRQVVGVRACSDHFPLILDTHPVKWEPTLFRFENMWLDHPSFRKECEIWWGNMNPVGWEGYKIMEKLKGLKDKLKTWNKESFGDTNLARSELLGRIERLDSKEEESGLDNGDREERKFLRNRLEEIIFKDMVAWK